jgi:hypothetical protein
MDTPLYGASGRQPKSSLEVQAAALFHKKYGSLRRLSGGPFFSVTLIR